MKSNVVFRILLAVVTLGAARLLAGTSFAQDPQRPPIKPPPYGPVFAIQGNFKCTDGVRGTFRQTEVTYSASSSSRTTVFTRRTDGATRTETLNWQANPDGTWTENCTATDYNAPSSFMSSRTVTQNGRGQSVGHGTYTTADGASGTLTTLETESAGGVNVLSTIYNSPSAGLSSELRTQTNLNGKTVVKTISVDAAGQSASLVQTRTVSGYPLRQS